MWIPLVRGRTFDDRDGPQATPVVIVDERLAHRFWPDEDPLARRLYFPSDLSNVSRITSHTQFLTVIGVVKEVHSVDPRPDSAPVGTLYLVPEQVATRALTFVVRSRMPPPAGLGIIRKEVADLDPQVPVFRARPMQEWIDRALVARRTGRGERVRCAGRPSGVDRRLRRRRVRGFTAPARIRRPHRAREHRRRNLLLALRDGATIVFGGLAVGLSGWLFVGRLMEVHLFGVSPADARIIAVVAVTLAVIALAAVIVPSWRASTVDPVAVLNS